MGVLWRVHLPIAKLLDQMLQKEFDRLSVTEERRVDDVAPIDDVSGSLIDENIASEFVAHGHAIKAFRWVANDRRVVCPSGLNK